MVASGRRVLAVHGDKLTRAGAIYLTRQQSREGGLDGLGGGGGGACDANGLGAWDSHDSSGLFTPSGDVHDRASGSVHGSDSDDSSDFQDAIAMDNVSLSGSFYALARQNSLKKGRHRRGDFGEGSSIRSGRSSRSGSGRSGSQSLSRSQSSRVGGGRSQASLSSLRKGGARLRSGSYGGRSGNGSGGGSQKSGSATSALLECDDEDGDEDEDDSHDTDDDSFMSMEEDAVVTVDVLQEDVDILHHALRQRELLRARIITDIRSIGNDPHKSSLLRALESDLSASESELQQLKVNYVEALMLLKEATAYNELYPDEAGSGGVFPGDVGAGAGAGAGAGSKKSVTLKDWAGETGSSSKV